MGVPLKSAVDVRLRLVSPPISQIAARLSVLEREQQHHSCRWNSPLKNEFHGNAEEFPVEKATQKERQGRDEQHGDQVLVFQIQKSHSSPEIAIDGRLVQWHLNSLLLCPAGQTTPPGGPCRTT